MPDGPNTHRSRDASLDWLKGALVAVMVFHHGIEYFDTPISPVLSYLDFVTGAFVFAALFIAGQGTQIPAAERATRALRGMWRGVKLILLFSCLNLAIHWMFGFRQFTTQLGSIYLGGNKQAASFEILLPIAYAQLITSASLFASWGGRIVIALLAFAIAGCMWSQAIYFNVYYCAIGLLAFVIGRSASMDSWGVMYRSGRLWAYAAVAFVVFASLTTLVTKDNILLYSVTVVAMCLVLRTAGSFAVTGGKGMLWMSTVGRYSLFSYIFHIAVLRALLVPATGLRSSALTGIVVSSGVFAVVVLVALLLDRARTRLRSLDYIYRVIFS